MGKIDDIQAYKEWTEYHRSLKRDKAADNLSPVERKKKLEKLEANVIEWILFFFSEFAKYPFTKFHKKAIKRITTNMEWYEVLSWSRELAKSTIVFMCMMYLVLTGKKRMCCLSQTATRTPSGFWNPIKKPLRAIPC